MRLRYDDGDQNDLEDSMHLHRCPGCRAQMKVAHSGTWRCLTCRRESLVEVDDVPELPNPAFHLAVCVLTAGLWLPVYAALLLAHGLTQRQRSAAGPTLAALTRHVPEREQRSRVA